MTHNRDAIYARAIDAETAWTRELKRTFGRDACNARYEKRGQGVPGGALNIAWRERNAAMAALHDYWHSRTPGVANGDAYRERLARV